MFSRGLIAVMFLGTLVCAKADEGKPLSEAELTEFLGSGATSSMTWSAVGGPDFVVYYGTAKPPLSGGAGIYLGNPPNFEPDPASTIVRGKLGIFPVKWRRTVSPDGAIRQETVRSLDDLDIEKAHVWVSAPTQTVLDQLVADLSRLPVFSHQYESEETSALREMVVQDRRKQLTASFFSGALFLGGAWFLDRQVRRRGASARRRGGVLAGYAVGWAILEAGLVFAAVERIIPGVFPLTNALYAVFTILGLSSLALILSLVVFVVSLFRPAPTPDASI